MHDISRLVPDLSDAVRMDLSTRDGGYCVRTAGGNMVRLSHGAFELLLCAGQNIPLEEMASRLSLAEGKDVSPIEAGRRLQAIVHRLERSASAPNQGRLWARVIILSRSRASTIARSLSWLFAPQAMAACLCVSLVYLSLVVCRLPETISHGRLDTYLIGAALFFPVLVFHEFGHAAACARFGAAPGEIGGGLYLLFPVLYSDVDDAWRLSCPHRLMVDLGGVYFQLIATGFICALYVATGQLVLLVTIAVSISSLLTNMNPVFKFDGYWVLCDILGVFNLGQQPHRLLERVGAKLRGVATPPLPWPAHINLLLAAYSVVSVVVWIVFVWNLGSLLLREVTSLPETLHAAVDSVIRGQLLQSAETWLTMFGLIVAMIVAFRFIYTALRAAKSSAVVIWSRFKRSRARATVSKTSPESNANSND